MHITRIRGNFTAKYQDELQDIHNLIMIGGWGCSQILQQDSAKLVPSSRPRSSCTEMLNPLAHIGGKLSEFSGKFQDWMT
jgi:hypothetical protein